MEVKKESPIDNVSTTIDKRLGKDSNVPVADEVVHGVEAVTEEGEPGEDALLAHQDLVMLA